MGKYRAVYEIQPDDCNHLTIFENGRRKFYERVVGEAFSKLLRGDASFVEHGAYSDDARRALQEIARLFKEGMIESITFKPYAVGPRFEYTVKPENVKVICRGVMETEYILETEDSVVHIVVPRYRPSTTLRVTVKPITRRVAVENYEVVLKKAGSVIAVVSAYANGIKMPLTEIPEDIVKRAVEESGLAGDYVGVVSVEKDETGTVTVMVPHGDSLYAARFTKGKQKPKLQGRIILAKKHKFENVTKKQVPKEVLDKMYLVASKILSC